MATQTTTTTDVATPDRLGLFSKLRGKFTIRKTSRPDDFRPSKNDPYRKARSVDMGRQPFISQPALVIRGHQASDSSESDSSPPAPRHSRARSSFDGGRNSSVFRWGRSPKSPVSPTMQKPEPPRAIDALPTPTDPASARAARQVVPSSTPVTATAGMPKAPERVRRVSNPSNISSANTSPAIRTRISPPTTETAPQIAPIDVNPLILTDIVNASRANPPNTSPHETAKTSACSAPQLAKSPASIIVATPSKLPSGNAPASESSVDAPQAVQGLPTTADPVLVSQARRSLELGRTSTAKSTTQPPASKRDDQAQTSTSVENDAPLNVDTRTSALVLPPSISRRGWQTEAHTRSISESSTSPTAPELPVTPVRLTGTLPARATPHLGSMPPRPISRIQLSSGVRVSPSITMRQPTMPILTLPPLPPLPPPTPSESAQPRPNSSVRLMSMPRLSMVGRSAEDDADHENAMLEETEEDEEHTNAHGEHSDDDASTEYVSARGSVHEEERPRMTLRPSRVFGGLASATGGLLDGTATPRAGRIMDYFSAKSPEKDRTPREAASPMRTPRAADVLATPAPLRTPGMGRLLSPRFESPRPGLHHVASRSMIDLLSPRTDRLAALTTKPYDAPPTGEPAAQEAPPPATLRRQTSMPTFNISSPPPPYPSFPPHSLRMRIVPREEEGRERLPAYTNDIYLRAILSRKMEFAGPGVQAKDRKWRRVLCELQGTVFRVYKCPPGAAGVGSLTQWWESKVGVGDLVGESGTGGGLATTGPAAIGRIESTRRDPTEQVPVPKAEGEMQSSATLQTGARTEPAAPPAPESRRSRLTAHLLPSRSSRGHQSMDTTRETPAASTINLRRASMPPSGFESRTSASTSRISSRPSMSSAEHSSSSSSLPKDRDVPEPAPKDLLRAYTLQNAESGLGSDYVKRKNVIRVRLEGEQFLLQAPDVAGVVDWIEGFQAGSNVALDLDERPMPRPPLFPRRRRRRVRRAESASGAAASSSGTTNAANGDARGSSRATGAGAR